MVQTFFINQDFSTAIGSMLPEGWSIEVIDGDPTIDLWRFDNPGDRTFPNFLDDPLAVFDSDAISNNDLTENVALVSPVFDVSASDTVYLKFDQQYLGLIDPDFGSEEFIEVYDGQTWQSVADQLDDVEAPTTIDISQLAAGVEAAQVRFRWTGNWSYLWAVDNVQVVDSLTPGVRLIGSPQVSEDNVPDPRNFQFVLDKPPTADVTLSFTVDGSQLQAIASLTFTPENWNIPQSATVEAVADGIEEGDAQTSPIQISVSSADPDYDGLSIVNAIASITDHTIPGFPSYRTVEKTYADLSALATSNPDLASWVDIGDTYDKLTPGGAPGYDLYALELGNKTLGTPGEKPVLFVQAAIHAREYVTTEVVTRFAEQLMAGYGVDADSTWLLDYFDIRVVPIVNPDGRKLAEQGYLWRKNTNSTVPDGETPADFPNYGVDLNRNYASKWGEVSDGASTDPSSATYQGPFPFSEPESQALRDYLLQTFPDQKGDDDFDPAPEDATGVYLDVHSFGNLVLYPFGWTDEPAPNKEGLRNLGLKLGYFTGLDGEAYDVQQAIGLYPTSGTTDDWVYDTFGVAAYTIEIGTQFFEPVDYFETTIDPEFIPALFYAAKSAYRPYQTSAGPDSVEVALSQGQVVQGLEVPLTLTAIADATRYDDGNLSSGGITEGLDLPTPIAIQGARYSIDAPSWVEGTELFDLTAADGALDSSVENLTTAIDTTGLSVGRHILFVESQDVAGNYGVPTAVFLDVLPAPEEATVLTGTDNFDALFARSNATHVLNGLRGDDVLVGRSGDDLGLGGSGDDLVKGQGGNDGLYGGANEDSLFGDSGADKLYGEAGEDTLQGGQGDDLLWGGGGDDLLKGGAGADTFVLAFHEGGDRIEDFTLDTDAIGLAGLLRFDQLQITDGPGAAVIQFGQEILAEVVGLTAAQLTAASFTTVPPTV